MNNEGWNALTNCLSTCPKYLPHITEHYVEMRSNGAVGDSRAGIPVASPSTPHANLLKVIIVHHGAILLEFLQVTLP